MIQLTIDFTEEEYNLLKKYAELSSMSVEQAVKENAQNNALSFLAEVLDVTMLSDEEVLALAHSLMDEASLERLKELQHKEDLSSVEQQELAVLWEQYWLGQYTKTEAMIEAQKRGLLTRSEIIG